MDAVKKASPDIMFVPAGTFKILWKKVVMDTSDAAQMAVEVGPKVFVPMHYGFLKGTKANLENLRCLKGNFSISSGNDTMPQTYRFPLSQG